MKNLFCIILISFLFSCSNNGVGELDNINTSDAVKLMFKKYFEETKKEGLACKLKYDARTLEGFWIYDGKLMDADSVSKINAAWEKQNKVVEYKLEDVHVFPITKTSASYHYKIEISYLDSAKKQKTLKQIESGVVTKVGDNWLYLNGNTTTTE